MLTSCHLEIQFQTKLYTRSLTSRQALLDCSERAATPTGIALVEDPGLSKAREAAEATPVESVRPVAEILADNL